MWENVQGHEQNKHFLQQLLLAGKRTPSLLFLGPSGIGKKHWLQPLPKIFFAGQRTCLAVVVRLAMPLMPKDILISW